MKRLGSQGLVELIDLEFQPMRWNHVLNSLGFSASHLHQSKIPQFFFFFFFFFLGEKAVRSIIT
jgi:hypothetical protein